MSDQPLAAAARGSLEPVSELAEAVAAAAGAQGLPRPARGSMRSHDGAQNSRGAVATKKKKKKKKERHKDTQQRASASRRDGRWVEPAQREASTPPGP
jgi:hypothetical protein